MALTLRQKRNYTHRCTVWRFTEVIDTDGAPGAKTWTANATAVKCKFQTGPSQHGLADMILAEQDNLYTLDQIHFDTAQDVKVKDVLKQTTGPDTGEFWEVRGEPKHRTRHANKQSVYASRLPTAPNGVT